MPRSTPCLPVRYVSALLAVAVALALRVSLWPVLGPEMPFLLLWPVVMFCAWFGGLGPGLLATLLAAAAGKLLLIEPHHSLRFADPKDAAGMALFLLLGVCLSVLGGRLARARREVERHARELFNQREWFRVTLSSIGDAVMATDAGGRVTFMNAVAQGLTGWKQQEALGLPLEEVFDIVHEETRAPVDSPVRKVLQTGSIVGLANHTVLITRDRNELPIDDSAAPIRTESGALLGVVLVFRDFTQQRLLEQELRRRAEQLASADRAKDEFLAMLAHELRNPLAPLRNAAEPLRARGSLDPDLQWNRSRKTSSNSLRRTLTGPARRNPDGPFAA